MEIEFIKWLVGYAEGFELSLMSTDQISIEMIDIEKVVSFSTNIVMGNGDPESNEYWLKVYYPLLLHRAIEGINKTHRYEIAAHYDVELKYSSQVFEWENRKDVALFLVEYYDYGSIDQAKEEALKYIYNQEKKNGY